jgi:hypothetical protein
MSDGKFYFLKVGKQDISVNGVRPYWIDIGDGWSYFCTSDRQVGQALEVEALKKTAGIMSSTREGILEKKRTASQRQSELDRKKSIKENFANPAKNVALGRSKLEAARAASRVAPADADPGTPAAAPVTKAPIASVPVAEPVPGNLPPEEEEKAPF